MPWRIISSGKINQDVKDVLLRADKEGRQNLVANTIDRIVSRLKLDPLAIGEPHNRLKDLDLLLCVVVDLPISIEYAVDENRHWVYLRQVTLL